MSLLESHRVGLVQAEDLAGAKWDCCVRIGDFVAVKLNATLLDQVADLCSRLFDSEGVLECVANEIYEIRIVIRT